MFKRIVINKLFVSHIFLAAMFCLSCLGVQAAVSPKFTVVIDAGHGGRDPGAMGQIAQEKNINLGVALKLGQKIAANFKDVNVLYTRKTDVFLTLQERANFVNQNSADLFICIHTNAAENRDVAGAETFTLGLDKLASNLDVAMRENSVMLLEEDYKTTYQGFDPNSVESYIMFEFMQDQYIDRSLSFASSVQEQFTRQYNRKDRGVRQAAFWVLHKSACPSVLIELGFITNKAEEQFLHSAKGQQTMADAIYDAFVEYKHQVEKKTALNVQESSKSTTQKSRDVAIVQTNGKPVYKIQIFSVKSVLDSKDPAFKGVKNTNYYKENGWYKYTVGEETDFQKIENIRMSLKKKFPDAFVVAFLNGEKISVKEARGMK